MCPNKHLKVELFNQRFQEAVDKLVAEGLSRSTAEERVADKVLSAWDAEEQSHDLLEDL